jgi:ABC-type Mn2+/Zn2+ transport system permease subunit
VSTIRYLTDPGVASLYWPGVIAGLAMAAMCAVLSVLVVVKRLAFIGQGISHAGFGGIGVAAVLGLTASGTAPAPMHGVPQFVVVLAFCLGAAVLIGVISRKGGRGEAGTHADTAIGIVLVATMALGAILLAASRKGLAWESFLFGSLLQVGFYDAGMACVLAAVTVGVLWVGRRGMLFWAFDEPAAEAFGVRGAACGLTLLVLLALATVTAMKLAGVVLATAMLVLPGAVALKLSARLWVVVALSVVCAGAGVLGGVVLSFEADWPPGPCIVGVLSLMFGVAYVLAGTRGTR